MSAYVYRRPYRRPPANRASWLPSIAASGPPTISNLDTSPALPGCAHIRWTTSALATQRVFWDTVSHPSDTDGTQYAFSSPNDTNPDTTNQFRFIPYLTPSTTYFYKVRSANADGVTFSAEGTFTTAANGVRTSNLLIIRVNFPNDLASLADDATINSQMQEVADYVDQYSFGQSAVTWDIVPGTLTAPHDTDFYKALESISNTRRAEQLAIDVSALALAEDFDTNDYFQYVIWIPQLYDWSNAGFFTGVNGRSQMHLNIFSANYLVQANLYIVGLGADGRANGWVSNDSTVFGSAGAPDPGGLADPFDLLGQEAVTANLNIKHKSGMGWLLPANIPVIQYNGVYRIYAHDTETALVADRVYGIRMPGKDGIQYWIEFRQSNPVNSVLINWGGLMLLDMVPTSGGFSNAPLTSGNTFTDPDGRAITFTSTGGTTPGFVDLTIAGLEDAPFVTVPVVTVSSTAVAPSVSLSPVTVTVPVTATDVSALAPQRALGSLTHTVPSVAVSTSSIAPTVSLGPKSLAVPVTATTVQVVSPTITVGTVSVVVPAVSVVVTAVAPAVSAGLMVQVPTASVSVTAAAPSRTLGAVLLSVPVVTVSSQAVAPTVVLGAVNVLAPTAGTTISVIPPVIQGAPVAVGVVTINVTADAPAVSLGVVSVTVPVVSVSLEVVAPLVPRTAVVPVTNAVVSAHAPSVVVSTVTVAVPVVTSTVAAVGPSVTLGPRVVNVPAVSVTTSVVAPSVVSGGAGAISVPVVSVGVAVVTPNVSLGSLSHSVPVVTIATAAVSPNVLLGAVTRSAPTVDIGTTTINPTVTLSAVVVSVPAVSVQASVIPPSINAAGGLPIEVPVVSVGVSAVAPGVTLGASILSVPGIGVSVTVSSPAVTVGSVSVPVPTANIQVTAVSPYTVNVGPAYSAVVTVEPKPIAEISVQLKPSASISRWT